MRLESSRAPRLHTSTPARLQRAFRASELDASIRSSRHTYIAPPRALHPTASTSLHQHRDSRVPCLPPFRHTCSEPPELLRQTPPRCYTFTATPELHASTSASRLQSS